MLEEELETHRVAHVAATNTREASELLRNEPSVGLVLTDETIPDGNWCSVLKTTLQSNSGSQLLVCTSQDHLTCWSEIVNRGGYYALEQPHRRKRLGELLPHPRNRKDPKH